MSCGMCYECKYLNRSCKSDVIRIDNYIPYFNYYCNIHKCDIPIYISEYKDGVFNWKQEFEETQLKERGCSFFEKYDKKLISEFEYYEQLHFNF